MSPQAHIVHKCRGRLRLKILEKRQDREYFAALQQQLEALPGIIEVMVNTVTGSVTLLHPELSGIELLSQLDELDLFEIVAKPQVQESALKPLLSGAGWIDEALSEVSTGSIDLRTLAVTGLTGLAAYQIYRGNILGPAIPLLLSALNMAQQDAKPIPD